MLEGGRNVCEEGEGKKGRGMEEVVTLGERTVRVPGSHAICSSVFQEESF
jgi:hypothetical protein